jgi:hypothetical protein
MPHPFIRQAETGGENYKASKRILRPAYTQCVWRNAHAGRRHARLACMPTTKKQGRPFCATGHQGGASLRYLRDTGFAVGALTRNPDQPQAL